MRVNSLRSWLVTAAALAGVALTLSLGNWQLNRAAGKNALHAAVESQASLPAVDTKALAGAPDPRTLINRRALIRGTWETGHQVFLDNRQMNGKPGFFVMAPFRLEGSAAAVLVQRGWVQRNFLDRTALPQVPTPPGTVELSGRIAPPPSQLYEPGASQGSPGASRIRQNLDLAAFAAETRLPLLGVSVLQTGAAGEGLLREWLEPSSGVAKHYGYAFQWFGLAALIAILYAWFQFIAPRRKARSP